MINYLADLGSNVNFRRVENVGPKVSGELLKAGFFSYKFIFSCNAILYLDKI